MKQSRSWLVGASVSLFTLLSVLFFIITVPVLAQDAPTTPPVPLSGRDSYLQNCAPCHGATGQGDGASAAGLGVPPTALGDYNKISARSLLELFDITKNGNMQRMMPPWKNRLSDQQIWDTVAYAWSLHTSTQEIEQGKQVYEANCGTCHGPDGRGAQPGAPNLADFATIAGVSQATWAQSLMNGKGAMPAFSGKLTDADQRAALEYVRSFSLGGPLFRGPLAKGAGVISGTVTNGTTGQPVPDLTVELGIFDQTSLLEQRSAKTDANGLYRFAELPTDADLSYAARVEYPTGIPSSTDAVTFEAGKTAIDLPIAVYETTTDPSGIRVERVHFIVEFSDGLALVAELLVFSLDGDRTYVGDGNGVLRFLLPAGARDLSINDEAPGGRFQLVQDGFVDLLPLLPGKSVRQMLYRYALPHTDGQLDFVRALPYPATAVNALVSDVGQALDSRQMTNQGVRQTQGGNYYNLVAENLPANQQIIIRMSNLSGANTNASGTAPASTASATSGRAALFVLIGVAAAAAAALVALPILRRRSAPTVAAGPADRDSLIDALAQLEMSYEAGQLTESAYRDQRLRLKAQLQDLARKEGQN